jgi:hypothetical protein
MQLTFHRLPLPGTRSREPFQLVGTHITHVHTLFTHRPQS